MDNSQISSLVVPLEHKNKGKDKDAKNYRALSINATLNKILMTVVLDRIRAVYENNILQNQFVFRRNRSTADADAKNVIAKTDGFLYRLFRRSDSSIRSHRQIHVIRLFDMLSGSEVTSLCNCFANYTVTQQLPTNQLKRRSGLI